MNLPPARKKKVDHIFIPYKDDEEEAHIIIENNVSTCGVSLVDTLVNTGVLLPEGESSTSYDDSNIVLAKVLRHFCDEDRNIISTPNIRFQSNRMM